MSGTDEQRHPRPGTSRREWLHTLVIIVGVLVLYFVAPLGLDDEPLPLPVATTLSVMVALGLSVMIGRQIVAVLEGRSRTGIPALLVLLVVVVVAFALAYFALERSDPGQVAGLRTRLDSFYFTVTTLVTVGFGDVHAQGQAARGIATVQMVFNAVFVAGLVRAMLYEAQIRRRGSQSPPPPL